MDKRRPGNSFQPFLLKSNFILMLLLAILAFASIRPLEAQTAVPAPPVPGRYTPAADPKAVIVDGNARFTILTPRLVRMEWAADGKFEDHASLVFLNRRLPVPKFEVSGRRDSNSGPLTITTGALEIRYHPAAGDPGKFTPDNLDITFMLNGKQVSWHPGDADSGNLMGTTRTLDGALGRANERADGSRPDFTRRLGGGRRFDAAAL